MIDEKTLEKWEEQKKELAMRIKRAKERNKYEKDKVLRLKREIVGRYYLELVEKQGQSGWDDLKKIMDSYLTLDAERILFGLQPLDKSARE